MTVTHVEFAVGEQKVGGGADQQKQHHTGAAV
jgi:hypothetical protein